MDEAAAGKRAGESCVLLIALRSAPVGFDSAWAPQEQPARDPFSDAQRRRDRRTAEAAFRGLLPGIELMNGLPGGDGERALAAAVAGLPQSPPAAGATPSWARDFLPALSASSRWVDWLKRQLASFLAPITKRSEALSPAFAAPRAVRAADSHPATHAPHSRPASPAAGPRVDELLVRQTPASAEHRSKHAPTAAAAAAAVTGTEASLPGRRLFAATAPLRWLGSEELSTQAATTAAGGALQFEGGGASLGDAPPLAGAAGEARPRRAETAALGGSYPGLTYVPMYGRAIGLNCNFSIDSALTVAKVDEAQFESKVMLYSLFILGGKARTSARGVEIASVHVRLLSLPSSPPLVSSCNHSPLLDLSRARRLHV